MARLMRASLAHRQWTGKRLTLSCQSALPRLHYLILAIWHWSGREDLNLRPPAPKAGALTSLRYAPQCRVVD
jgi:hypothetical protein